MSNEPRQILGRRDAKGHGGGVRGADTADRSVQFEGRFGRLFRALPPARFEPADLRTLAAVGRMTAESETRGTGASRVRIATAEGEIDDEENFGIPAGYTYFGQFVDHDLTFDPASSLQGQNDPDALTDFRTPRFDLDSLYGRGPDDQPYMYDASGRGFLLGRPLTRGGKAPPQPVFDLPRTVQGRAIIGDKRNDENVIVSQLHGLFLRFHNRLAQRRPDCTFPEVQRLVRWHYQWVVLHDFLPRIVGQEMVDAVLPHLRSGKTIFEDPPRLDFYRPRHEAYIPVEFSVAAYRFGHSMVRPIYRLNQELGKDDADTHTNGRQFIFAAQGKSGLNGFREFPAEWAIDWRLFLEFGDEKLSPRNTTERKSARVQPSYKIDTSLVNPLDFLPEFCVLNPKTQDFELGANGQPQARINALEGVPEVPNLALRNLLRGMSMGLPSGQDVARAMGLEPLPDERILIGKATAGDNLAPRKGGAPANRSIVDCGASFRGNAPLWVYVLAEAQARWAEQAELARRTKGGADPDTLPVHLGPVGGRIVAETLIGMLLADSHSFLSQSPAWTPELGDGKTPFTLASLVTEAMAWKPEAADLPPAGGALRYGGGGAEPTPMRVQLRPGSPAERAWWGASGGGALAALHADPDERLIYRGGKTLPQMEFQNVYLGKKKQWAAEDVVSIDGAILKAMQLKSLNNVMQQYFDGKSLACDSRDSIFFDPASLATIDEPAVQRIVTQLFQQQLIARRDLDSCVFNLLLPAGSVLALDGLKSTAGLGGFHGSVHVQQDGRDVTLYYSANVLSQRLADGTENGIVGFDKPWKNIVATLYHELNEFRTDPDVSDGRIGWNSRTGREVGDEPLAVNPLADVLREVPGSKKSILLPVQFLYSNASQRAQGPIATPQK